MMARGMLMALQAWINAPRKRHGNQPTRQNRFISR